MITSQLEFTSQKYRKKRTEALKNIAVLQQKLKKPVRIFSEKNRSKQKNSKKKGFSVEWVYQPETKLLDYAHSLSSIRNSKMSKIYVRITIYDETHKEKYNDNKKPHLIPMEALEQYFCVADAIRADRLFELYEDIPPKLWDKGDVLEEQDPKYIDYKRRFFERTAFVNLFAHGIQLFDDQEMPKAVSNFTIGFCPKNKDGETVCHPWKLTCWDAQYDRDEVYSTGVCCYEGEQVMETAVVISQEKLLQILDGTYQKLCDLLGEAI